MTKLKKKSLRQKSKAGSDAGQNKQLPDTKAAASHKANLLGLKGGWWAPWLLAAITCACLLPFLTEAFHIDDPLFLWTAKQVVQHPLDPYGFDVVWYASPMPMADINKNPPLSAYFLALAGSIGGWSEPILHLAFMIPAIAVIVGVFLLARDLTQSPIFAACLALATPGFMVSATSVMSDVPMLACWLFAILLWRKGMKTGKLAWFAGASILIAICALTKYFGVSLIPLLLLQTLYAKRRLGKWLIFLGIPCLLLAGYEAWTAHLYGHGLLSDAMDYSGTNRSEQAVSTVGSFLVALNFVGGCCLPILLFIAWLWSRVWIGAATIFAVLGTAALLFGWVDVGAASHAHTGWLFAFQVGLYMLGGISALCLALADFRRRRDADSIMLVAWVLGTFVFAAFLNWTVNARSVLPVIPALAILIARRLDDRTDKDRANDDRTNDDRTVRQSSLGPTLAVIASLILTLWIAVGDRALANSARSAALEIGARARSSSMKVAFSGHWGFQYYMQNAGGDPLDQSDTLSTTAKLLAYPRNNTNQVMLNNASPLDAVSIPINTGVTTMERGRRAGFYTSMWGIAPFVFGPVPAERYDIFTTSLFQNRIAPFPR